jgi:hypothetical protein
MEHPPICQLPLTLLWDEAVDYASVRYCSYYKYELRPPVQIPDSAAWAAVVFGCALLATSSLASNEFLQLLPAAMAGPCKPLQSVTVAVRT